MLSPNSLKSKPGARQSGRGVLGRGASSGFGTTAGRGTKGQRARSGSRKGLKVFGSKAMILSLPKMRGFKSMATKAVTITLVQLQKHFADGTIISPEALVKAKLIKNIATAVKLVGNGTIEKKFTLEDIALSAGARAAITAAGGSVK